MMSSSFSEEVNHLFPVPVSSFLYRDISLPVSMKPKETKPSESTTEIEAGASGPSAPSGPSPEEIDVMLRQARSEANIATEKRLVKQYEERSEQQAAKIKQAIEDFQLERKSYFSRVESEVVQLALAIAAKILHREAQVDPTLVAALVRFAVDQLHAGSSVTVRVPEAEVAKWSGQLANPANGSKIEVVGDANVGADDCLLETDLGSANFSIDAQLKEVEQGFFDLLALRPTVK